jgi:hypothetical protein
MGRAVGKDFHMSLRTEPSHDHGTMSNTKCVCDKKQEFTRALNLWTLGAKLQAAVERAEFARFDSLMRMLLLRNSVLAGTITIARNNPRADCKTAIFTIITMFSDNDEMLCTLYIKRMAQMLNRSERRVMDTINALEAEGLIGVNRTPNGFANTYYPRIPAFLVDSKGSITWYADALSEAVLWGRPKKADEKPLTSMTGVLGEEATKKPLSSMTKTPDIDDAENLLRESTKEKKVVGAPQLRVDAATTQDKGSVINAAPTTTTRKSLQEGKGQASPSKPVGGPRKPRQMTMVALDPISEAKAAQRRAERATDDEMLAMYNRAAEKHGMHPASVLTPQRRQMLRALRYHRDESGELSLIAINWRRILGEILPGAIFPKWKPMNFYQAMQLQFWAELLEGQHSPVATAEEPEEIIRARQYAKFWAKWLREEKTQVWPTKWGPAPGTPGCQIPAEIFGEFGLDASGQPVSKSGTVPTSGVLLHGQQSFA